MMRETFEPIERLKGRIWIMLMCVAEVRVVRKRNFQKGGGSPPGIEAKRQACSTFLEIYFESRCGSRFAKAINASRIFAIAAGLLLPLMGHAQTYFYSGSINGYTEVGLNPGSGYTGQMGFHFGELSETLYYDPVAGTLRTAGTVTIDPTGGSFNMKYRSGPVLGSANVALGSGDRFSFDMEWERAGSVFFTQLSVPVSGSGEYDGTAFSGGYQMRLPMSAEIISTDENILTFNQCDRGSVFGEPVMFVNGCLLYDGAGGDNTIHWSWQMNSVTATVVPEPCSFSLLTLGMVALGFVRRR